MNPNIPAPDGLPPRELNLYEKILVQLKPEVDTMFYNCYLKPAEQFSLTDDLLTIGVDDQHKREWLADRAGARIRQLASGISGRVMKVEFIYVGEMF